jgi:predicted nucleic acid-binding protein
MSSLVCVDASILIELVAEEGQSDRAKMHRLERL